MNDEITFEKAKRLTKDIDGFRYNRNDKWETSVTLEMEPCPKCGSPVTIVTHATIPGIAGRSCPVCETHLGEV